MPTANSTSTSRRTHSLIIPVGVAAEGSVPLCIHATLCGDGACAQTGGAAVDCGEVASNVC